MEDNINEWLSGDYLLVKDVQDQDIIEYVSSIGLVDSFGKKKFQIEVMHNGVKKILNLNKVQYYQMEPLTPGKKFVVNKISIKGGTALNYKWLIQRL